MPSEKGYLLPENIDAPTFCFSIQVPNDKYFVAAVMAQLEMLTYWYMWQRDADHTARLVAARWYPLFNAAVDAMNRGLLICPPAIPPSGGAEGDENLIRQNPANPCELQTSIDGTHWCTFADLSLCFASLTGQPSAPQDQPAPGGCQVYSGKLQANETFLVPVVVNAGDTVEVTHITGAGSDNGIAWYCPDGSTFFAGACGVAGAPLGGDPAPLLNHMSVLVKIGSVYYPATGGSITVPGGIVNQQVTLLVNAPVGTGKSGEYALSVNVCNNQAVSWSHIFDFALNPQGWAITPGDCGHWSAGVGWVSELNPPTCSYDIVTIQRALPAIAGGGYSSFKTVIHADVAALADMYAASGADTFSTVIGNNTLTFTRAIANGDLLKVDAAVIPSNGSSGQFIIKSVTLTGTGPEPVW